MFIGFYLTPQSYENNGTDIIPASQCGWIIHYISPTSAKILGMLTPFVWKLERGMQEREKVMVQECSRVQVE